MAAKVRGTIIYSSPPTPEVEGPGSPPPKLHALDKIACLNILCVFRFIPCMMLMHDAQMLNLSYSKNPDIFPKPRPVVDTAECNEGTEFSFLYHLHVQMFVKTRDRLYTTKAG